MRYYNSDYGFILHPYGTIALSKSGVFTAYPWVVCVRHSAVGMGTRNSRLRYAANRA